MNKFFQATIVCVAALSLAGCAGTYHETGKSSDPTGNAGEVYQQGYIFNQTPNQVLNLKMSDSYYSSDFQMEGPPARWSQVRKVVVGPDDGLTNRIRVKPGPHCVWIVEPRCCGREPMLRSHMVYIDADETNANGYGWKIWLDKRGGFHYSP